jgi:hypothetical protein
MTDQTARVLLLALITYAGAGLAVAVGVHLLALAGRPPGGAGLFAGLNVALFALMLPVTVVWARLTKSMKPPGDAGFWTVVFAACPAWMKLACRASYLYAFVVLAAWILIGILSGKPSFSFTFRHDDGDPPALTWIGFSSIWMVMHSASLALLTTAYRRLSRDAR